MPVGPTSSSAGMVFVPGARQRQMECSRGQGEQTPQNAAVLQILRPMQRLRRSSRSAFTTPRRIRGVLALLALFCGVVVGARCARQPPTSLACSAKRHGSSTVHVHIHSVSGVSACPRSRRREAIQSSAAQGSAGNEGQRRRRPPTKGGAKIHVIQCHVRSRGMRFVGRRSRLVGNRCVDPKACSEPLVSAWCSVLHHFPTKKLPFPCRFRSLKKASSPVAINPL